MEITDCKNGFKTEEEVEKGFCESEETSKKCEKCSHFFYDPSCGVVTCDLLKL